MRFVRVVVKGFRAIEHAEVDFGPGLNVLHGANDLGKSTLASAMRAALLMPTASSEAQSFQSWYADTVPEVTLTFTDDEGRFWRVHKCFGSSGGTRTANLYHSKDGVGFTRDSGGREVDGQLRDLLGWGIPAPGGKGAPKRLPTSFLAHVLLAEQSEVETILSQSTDDDGTGSGHERLRKALAGLAEDPWFKKVLTHTQQKVDELFTPSGQRKRGRSSPFAMAAEDIKRRAERVAILNRSVLDSRATEELLQKAREACVEAQLAWEEADRRLAEAREQHTRTLLQQRALAAAQEANDALQDLNRRATELQAREHRLSELSASVSASEARVAEARAQSEQTEAALRAAEDALRVAQSDDGARQRELARAQWSEERAQWSARLERAEQRERDLAAAQRALLAVAESARARAEAERVAADTERARDQAKGAAEHAENKLEQARAVLTFGQLSAARMAGAQAAEAKEKARGAQADAAASAVAAQERAARALELEQQQQALSAEVPEPARLRALELLAQEIAVAEAALGGGFSLALRRAGELPVQLTIDGAAVPVDRDKLVIEAERAAALRVSDLIELEISVGGADKRRELQALRERWSEEAEPVLKRAGLATLAALRERIGAVDALRTQAQGLRAEAQQIRLEEAAARQTGALWQQRAETFELQAQEVSALQQRLGARDPQLLTQELAQLKGAWPEQKPLAQRQIDGADQAYAEARGQLVEAERACILATAHGQEASRELARREAEAERALAAVGCDGAEPLQRMLVGVRAELEEARARQLAIDAELQAQQEHASSAVREATRALDLQKSAHSERVHAQSQAVAAHEAARSALDSARGEVDALRRALSTVDRAAVEAKAVEADRVLATFADLTPVTPEQVTQAEQHREALEGALDAARSELNQREGALSKVGGLGVREELAREEEAHTLAKERQRELEIDADAWQLLRDTLDSVQKEGSSHLGRSLAEPVSQRLAELTQGRYGALQLGPHLRAEGMQVSSVSTADKVLDALSVGTRDQVATLLRLTVAEQLKSAIVLDDHLVHTDLARLTWFRELLRKTALSTQVIVLTCRAGDYLSAPELAGTEASRDFAGGLVRSVDLGQALRRFACLLLKKPEC